MGRKRKDVFELKERVTIRLPRRILDDIKFEKGVTYQEFIENAVFYFLNSLSDDKDKMSNNVDKKM